MSVLKSGLSVLSTASLPDKIRLSREAVSLWTSHSLDIGDVTQFPLTSIPDHPARPPRPRLVEPHLIQNPRKTAKAHNVSLATVLLHNISHVELNATDLYWDTIMRFVGRDPLLQDEAHKREFCQDFLMVISDEARHLDGALCRLKELGAEYGLLDCHKSLWDIGIATKDDLAARLALVPLVQEARGLDAGPRLVEQLMSANDHKSAKLMQMIYEEEVRHVGTGMKWFKRIAESRNQPDVDVFFHTMVRRYMPTGLIPPFNEMARAAAGMGINMYQPLAAVPPARTRNPVTTYFKRAYSTTRTLREGSRAPPHCLFVSSQWPETRATAAGLRTMGLLQMFKNSGFEISYASMAKNPRPHVLEELASHAISMYPCAPNDTTFPSLLAQIQPSAVVFDRFFVEEMFGWQVQKLAPTALRILDSQDLHFLRKSREDSLNAGGARRPLDARDDVVWRELASIQRSDVTLIISEAEHDLLANNLRFPVSKLFYLPLCYRDTDLRPWSEQSFASRNHVCTIGNFQHAPNVDALTWLCRDIWPEIRKLAGPEVELHIYGSHSKPEHAIFHLPKSGRHLRGYVENQYEALAQHRVLLAPLRFGAGQKGKVSDSWVAGTPVVGTAIAAEGMTSPLSPSWGGEVADSPEEIAQATLRLLRNKALWDQASKRGAELLKEKYDFAHHQSRFTDLVAGLMKNLEAIRPLDWMAATLFASQHRATEYLSKYIQAKNEKK